MRASARLRTALRSRVTPSLRSLLVPAVAVALCATAVPAEAADRQERLSPGPTSEHTVVAVSRDLPRAPVAIDRWTGYAFDACRAPSTRTMDRWRVASPFTGVGIYIGGALRACPQRHLTRGWVRHQTQQGWKLLPIWVGPQASCTSYRQRISSSPGARGRYPAARAQGARAARFAKAAASDLGLRKGSTLWYDLEWFRAYRHRCRTSALHFLSAWTEELHRGGYVSGVYSSVSAGIAAAGEARGHARYTLPDRVWFAWSNGRHDVSWGRYLRAPGWRVDRRVHQYALDVRASYGGVSMAIDRNFVDLGSSPEVRSAPALCGRTADRRSYPTLRRGSRGPAVRVADCLLEAGGHLDGVVDGAFELATARAVRSFQRSRGMKVNGRLDERVWSALLTRGPRTVLKRGSEGGTVRRVQRALTAALPGAVAVHGHFGPGTASAVRRFQDRAGLRVTGIVNPATWHALSTGDITQPKPKRPHGKGKGHRPPKRHGAHQQGKGKADQLKHKVGKHAHRHPKRPHRR